MDYSTSDAKVYGLEVLGAAGVLAAKGLAGLARYTYEAYEARTNTPQERIDTRVIEAERYAKQRRFDRAAGKLVAAEKVARDYNVSLPGDFDVRRRITYQSILDSAVDSVMESPRAVDSRNLDDFVNACETLARTIGPTAQGQLEKVQKFALQRHLRLASEYVESAEDRGDNLLSWARYHLKTAREFADGLKLTTPEISLELSLVDSLIREKENTSPSPYNYGY